MGNVAHVQNGREVTWDQVTTEDLRVTIVNYPDTSDATAAREEWKRRMGRPFETFFVRYIANGETLRHPRDFETMREAESLIADMTRDGWQAWVAS